MTQSVVEGKLFWTHVIRWSGHRRRGSVLDGRWLRAEWAASETGRGARFYTLTALGRKQLGEQRANWDRLSVAIAGILSTTE